MKRLFKKFSLYLGLLLWAIAGFLVYWQISSVNSNSLISTMESAIQKGDSKKLSSVINPQINMNQSNLGIVSMMKDCKLMPAREFVDEEGNKRIYFFAISHEGIAYNSIGVTQIDGKEYLDF